MSVPYLMNDSKGHIPASEKIPIIARPFVSDRAKKTLDLVCVPIRLSVVDVFRHRFFDGGFS